MVVSDLQVFMPKWNPIWIDALLPDYGPPCLKSSNVKKQLGYNDVGIPVLSGLLLVLVGFFGEL
jgi:hypothetical protein